jgi:effector-binding domain-containing protein
MKMKKLLPVVLLALLPGGAIGAQAPTTAPQANVDLTPTRFQQIRGADFYLHGSTQTTLANIRPSISGMIGELVDAANSGKIQATGPMVAVYTGLSMDMTKPFQAEVGFPVRAGTATWGIYQLRPLQPLRAATTIYRGSLSNEGQAYQKLYNDIFAAGFLPGTEAREMYLYWDGVDSTNNIVLIQVEIIDKPKP